MSTVDGRNVRNPWHSPHFGYRPSCGSTWHAAHSTSFSLNATAALPMAATPGSGGRLLRSGPWQALHSISACRPSRRSRRLAWAATVKVLGFQPATRWQASHAPRSGRLASWLPWSSPWQSRQTVAAGRIHTPAEPSCVAGTPGGCFT